MVVELPETGRGRLMRYPYGKLGKVFAFPFKHHWTHGRGFRYACIAMLFSLPIIYPIHKAVNSPGNVEMWREIRAKRKHDPFAPPTEHGGHH